MNKIFWCATCLLGFGTFVHNQGLIDVGGVIGAIWLTWFVIRMTRRAAVSGTQLAIGKFKENQAEKREEKEYQKQLRRELDREKMKSEMQLEIYKKQIDLMIEYKKKGADITKELFDMRKNLLELESIENKNMIQDILQTLDSI